MLVAKILFNSVVSTRNAKFMTMDISDFYLMTPLKRPEYIRISIKEIPKEIINKYKLRDIVDDKGSIHIQSNRGMFGLTQAGLLSNKLPEKRLNKRGYRKSKLVHGFGHTIGDQYSSHSSWTILKSNTWERNIQYTSRIPLRKITL